MHSEQLIGIGVLERWLIGLVILSNAIAFFTDPFGTYIELTEELDAY